MKYNLRIHQNKLLAKSRNNITGRSLIIAQSNKIHRPPALYRVTPCVLAPSTLDLPFHNSALFEFE